MDDAGDSGLQLPVFTDTAIKGGLAKISEWAFRNVPNENEMYRTLFLWVKESYPELETMFGGVEEDFAHSRFTWYQVMDKRAQEAGFEVKGFAKWLLADTNFTQQVREMKKAKADFVALSSHPFTLCGILKEMNRQRVRPKLMIGLTSSSSMETLQGCAKAAERDHHPEQLRAGHRPGQAGRQADRREGRLGRSAQRCGMGDRRGSRRSVIESEGIMATADTVQEDRRKIRDGLAKLETTNGLIGTIMREMRRRGDQAIPLRARAGRSVGRAARPERELARSARPWGRAAADTGPAPRLLGRSEAARNRGEAR